MSYLQQILFIVTVIVATAVFVIKVREIRANILLGRDEDYSDRPGERWRNLLLLAFGQKKMFRNPLVAVLHFVIYAGFIIINIEVPEIILEGIFNTHPMVAPVLGGFYTFVINFFELLAAGVC